MSQNPYQNSPMPSPAGVAPQQKPGGLTAVAVICLILGMLGALGSIFALAMLGFQDSINQLQNAQPGAPGAEFQAKIQELQADQFLPNLIFGGCNLIVGSLLAIGSIGVLGVKEWGRNLLRNALLVAIIFIVIRGAYGIWIQVSMIGAMKEMMATAGGDAGTFESALQVGFIIGIVIAVVMLVGFVCFYGWSRWYLGKPNIKALFAAAN